MPRAIIEEIMTLSTIVGILRLELTGNLPKESIVTQRGDRYFEESRSDYPTL
ncbi:MAG UNVERIFIED_CONTAM: hypothetical protein LVR29_04760 [Microcystis novacekii LVE1205-3]